MRLLRQHSLLWTVVAISALGPVASLLHVLHEQHSVCAEHPGASHHGDSVKQVELASLRAQPERFPDASKHKTHDHCGVMGAFDRACEKAKAGDALKPALAPKKQDTPPSKRSELPEVIYAYAPKHSPPLA